MPDPVQPSVPQSVSGADPVTDSAVTPAATPAEGAAAEAVPSAGLPDPITKTALLAALRAIEAQLYSAPVVAKVKQEPPAAQMEFAQSRLLLTATIAQLNASLMGDIREQLQAQSASLDAGIGALSASLGKLEAAAGWATAVDSVVKLLGKAVSLL